MSDLDCREGDVLAVATPMPPSAAPLTSPPSSVMPTALASAMAAIALAACGGGEDPNEGNDGRPSGGGPVMPVEQPYITRASKPDLLDAWRFMNQATFGPKADELDALMSTGYTAWLDAQIKMPQAISTYALTHENYDPTRKPLKIGPLYADPSDPDADKRKGLLSRAHVSSAWWEKVLTGQDQLRQRVAYALSQILVIAMPHGGAGDMPYACASYYDLLLDGAFGSFTELLTKVSGHPAMAVYLSSLGNRRPVGNRIPDQNFAREIMQLFSVGLNMLNMDGTLKRDVQGKPIETYTPYDIEVLSHVFTGWSWQHAFDSYVIHHHLPASQAGQMKAYPQHHSTYDEFPKKDAEGRVLRYPNAGGGVGSVTLLGKPLALASTAGMSEVASIAAVEADRKAALDIIFSHPNVAPFIAKQMIQWLVTSNPSPPYVRRAAEAFQSSGLNLEALVRAIVLDKEARDVVAARSDPTFGRLREPLLRVTQFMRAFGGKSVGDKFHVSSLAAVSGPSIAECLGQAPLESPSVFNFYRPGYMAPNSRMAARGKVTPEMQISSETDVAAYMRFMEVASLVGFGTWVKKDGMQVGGSDQQDSSTWSYFLSVHPDYTPELALSVDQSKPQARRRELLIDAINKKLYGGTMSTSLKNHLATLADEFGYASSNTGPGGDAMTRFATLAYVATIVPEYVVQR